MRGNRSTKLILILLNTSSCEIQISLLIANSDIIEFFSFSVIMYFKDDRYHLIVGNPAYCDNGG